TSSQKYMFHAPDAVIVSILVDVRPKVSGPKSTTGSPGVAPLVSSLTLVTFHSGPVRRLNAQTFPFTSRVTRRCLNDGSASEKPPDSPIIAFIFGTLVIPSPMKPAS